MLHEDTWCHTRRVHAISISVAGSIKSATGEVGGQSMASKEGKEVFIVDFKDGVVTYFPNVTGLQSKPLEKRRMRRRSWNLSPRRPLNR